MQLNCYNNYKFTEAKANIMIKPYILRLFHRFASGNPGTNKKIPGTSSRDHLKKCIMTVYYFFALSFNSSLSLSEGFQTLTSAFLSIPDKI